MSDKLTDLPAATTATDDDLVYMVDVSDATDDPAGSSKVITKNDFLGGGAGTTMTVKKKLQTITNTTAGEFDFDNIPAGYDRLIIEGQVRGDASVGSEDLHIYFNEELTDANYHSQQNIGSNGANSSTEANVPKIAVVTAASAPANAYATVRVVMENFAGAYIKSAISNFTAYPGVDQQKVGEIVATAESMTAAITRIRIRTDNHSTDQLLGVLHLYAEKEVVVGSYSQDAAGTTVQAKVPLAVIDNTAAAGEFDFDNIPAGYDRLIIEGELRGDVSADVENVNAYFNADVTDANYHRQNIVGSNGVANVVEGATPQVSICPGDTSPANAYGLFHMVVEDYAGINLKHALGDVMLLRSAGNMFAGSVGMMSSITAAITRLRIRTDNHATDQLFGKLRLYGEKQIVIAPGKHEIETITNATAGEFDFNNIPSGYKRLIIQGELRSDAAVDNDNAYIYFNEELTDANYHSQGILATNGGSSFPESSTPRLADISAASSLSDAFAQVAATIENYAGSNRKIALAEYGSPRTTDNLRVGQFFVSSGITAAITRLRIRTDNHATDQLFGTLTLYGEM